MAGFKSLHLREKKTVSHSVYTPKYPTEQSKGMKHLAFINSQNVRRVLFFLLPVQRYVSVCEKKNFAKIKETFNFGRNISSALHTRNR